MNNRFNAVYFGLKEILQNTLGRQVKVFGNLQEREEVRILEQFELVKDDNKRLLKISLRFKDSSSKSFDRIASATIDWGYRIKRTKPLVWLYDEGNPDDIYKIWFDVKLCGEKAPGEVMQQNM